MGEPVKIFFVTRMNTNGDTDSVSAIQPYFMRLTGAFLFIPTNLPTIPSPNW